jgi:hypothetical protein
MKRTLLAVALLTAGCPGWKDRAGYMKAHDQHTDHLTVYRDLANVLTLHGTYLSPSFREAIAAERRRLLAPTDEAHDRYVRILTDDGEAYHEVVFTAESVMVLAPELRFGESDAGWHIRLEADGVIQPLVTVFQIDPPTAVQRAIYAQSNEFNTLWMARFERVTREPARVVLKVGSGYGHGELSWGGTALR